MPEFLKTIDSWFLVLCALGFLYLVSRSFGKFDKTLDRFEQLFDKVFKRHEEFEGRLSKLEGRCEERDC